VTACAIVFFFTLALLFTFVLLKIKEESLQKKSEIKMKEVEFIFQWLRRNLNLIFVMADKKFSPKYQDFSLWSVKWT
jgi:hypothetical protein